MFLFEVYNVCCHDHTLSFEGVDPVGRSCPDRRGLFEL
jgi:hypothetical protein